jgi:hypothetical protein
VLDLSIDRAPLIYIYRERGGLIPVGNKSKSYPPCFLHENISKTDLGSDRFGLSGKTDLARSHTGSASFFRLEEPAGQAQQQNWPGLVTKLARLVLSRPG